MDLTKDLEQFGFADNEAVVYANLLQSGPSTVLSIARGTGLKRPTVYLILDELLKKGVVALVPKEKKKLYIALSPAYLVETMERKAEKMRNILPELLMLWKTSSSKPSVQFFESREGMLNVYREVTKNKNIKEVLTFFSPEAIPKDFEQSYDMFLKLFSEHKVMGRDIVSTNMFQHYYFKKLSHFPNYQVRFTTPKEKFFNDTIIYGNKVAIISFKKQFALIIESEDAANSLKSLFELAWQSAEILHP